MQFVLRRTMLAALMLFLLASSATGQVVIGPDSEDRSAPATQADPAADTTPTPPLDGESTPAEPLSDQVEALKDAVLDLNRDLLILEEELLFPANTQVAIFLSMDVGEFFHLDSVKVEIDEELVASDLYTPQEADALFRGGVQRLFVGNLKSGSHVVTAFFTGKGPEGREYKRGATMVLEKELAPKMLELRIVDSTRKLQPVFDIKEWEL